MAIGVTQNQQALDLKKLDDSKSSTQTQNLNTNLSQQAREEAVRAQLSQQFSQQQSQQDFLRAFQGAGNTQSSHKEILARMPPAHAAIANELSTKFIEGIRQSVALQMTANSGGLGATSSDDTAATPDNEKPKETTHTGGLGSSSSRQSAAGLGNSSSSGTMDDGAVTQVVQGAMSGVYSQLYGIVNKMQGTQKDKATLNDIENVYQTAIGSGKDPVPNVPVYNITFDSTTGKLSVQYEGTKTMTQAELASAKSNIDDTKDSMSDMSTMDQMTLQQAMEQKGQFESVFSNMLKTYQSTASGILANLKD